MPSPLPDSVNRFIARHGAAILEGILEAADDVLTSYPVDQLRRAIDATPLFPKMPPHSAFCLASAIRAVESGMAMTTTYRYAGSDQGIEVYTELKRNHADLAKPPRSR